MNNKQKQDDFLELIDPLRDKLFMYALALEKSREDAEDLVSETILSCYEAFDRIEDYSLFKGYVFKVARNNFRRKNRRKWLFGYMKDEDLNNIESNDSSPLLPLEIETLYKALDMLPHKQKEAIVLFEISGFSQLEISKMQTSSVSAVKSRIKRGKEKLQVILTNLENENSSKYEEIANKINMVII